MASTEAAATEVSPAGPTEESGQLTAVLEALGDATCRLLLRALHDGEAPLTVQELSSLADVSLTSTYRKVDLLAEAGLLEERDEVDLDGHRRARYRPVVDQIEVRIGSADCPEVTLFHAAAELGPAGR